MQKLLACLGLFLTLMLLSPCKGQSADKIPNPYRVPTAGIKLNVGSIVWKSVGFTFEKQGQGRLGFMMQAGLMGVGIQFDEQELTPKPGFHLGAGPRFRLMSKEKAQHQFRTKPKQMDGFYLNPMLLVKRYAFADPRAEFCNCPDGLFRGVSAGLALYAGHQWQIRKRLLIDVAAGPSLIFESMRPAPEPDDFHLGRAPSYFFEGAGFINYFTTRFAIGYAF